MPDNFDFTPGSGATGAADNIGGVLHPRVKLTWGVDGTATDVSASNPLPVVAALPTGAATEATLAGVLTTTDFDSKVGSLTETAPTTDTASSGLNGRLQRIAQRLTSLIALLPTGLGTGGGLKVDGSGTALPVSGTMTANAGTNLNTSALALETGGNLATIAGAVSSSKVAVKAASGDLADGAIATLGTKADAKSTATDTTSITIMQVLKQISASIQAAASSLAGTLTVASHAVTNAGTFAVQAATAGDVASGSSDSGNPVKLGFVGKSSEPTAVTTGQRVNGYADLVGKQIVLPYANPENFVSGAITTAMTGTTSTSLVASPGGSLRNYITQVTVSNSHATVGTDVVLQDGSGGTTLYTIPAAALYGGAVITFPTPLRQPTTATALYCANVTTGASTKVSASGYKGL